MSHATALLSRLSNRRLRVIPYVRGRLVFAEIAASTLQEKVFDTVLVDLPCFMNHQRWLDTPLASFPLVSSLLVKKDDGECSLYPLVPTDAACAVAWLARSRSQVFECVDPLTLISPCLDISPVPTPELRDERRISNQGLESYFEPAWLELDDLWEKAPDATMRSLITHGVAVADRISARVPAGRDVFFVCEYRLWWAVRKAMEEPLGSRARASVFDDRQRTYSGARLLEDPYLLWAAGLFDDYPAINRRFHESLVSGSTASFTKFAILEDLLLGCFRPAGTDGAQFPSQDALTSLIRSLRSEAEWKNGGNLPPARFLDHARSCLGPEAGDALVRSLLEYPIPTTADAALNPPEYFEIAGETVILSNRDFDLPDVFHVRPYGEPRYSGTDPASPAAEDLSRASWLHSIHPVITRQEAKKLGEKAGDSRWAVERDYELHAQACTIVRRAVAREELVGLEGEELGTHTPVVFLFSNDTKRPRKLTLVCDHNATGRQMQLQGREHIPLEPARASDYVYSLFATTRALESLFESHVEREVITSLALLFSGTGMGLERYAAITRQPRRYQCRIRPQDDPALVAFKPSDLGLAWTLKYARNTTIAVAFPGWEPSQALRKFARRRRKRILTVPLNVLPEDLIQRLTQLHFISNALKTHPDYERIVARFVR